MRSFANSYWTLASLLGLLLVTSACGGVEPEPQVNSTTQGIVAGTLHSGDPEVGLLLTQKASSSGVGICTATLVGAKIAVTAAHCVEPDGRHLLILDDVRYNVASVVRHPNYADKLFDYDVAIVKLAAAPGLKPAALGVEAPVVGQELTLIGYGVIGQDADGSGVKRIASNTVASLRVRSLSYRSAGNGVGNVCFGDSGGPSFATINDQRVVVGIHSFVSGSCGVLGTDMRVDAFLSWFKQEGGEEIVVGGEPPPPPPPRKEDGLSCDSDGACLSGLCAGDPVTGEETCGQRCFAGDSCAAGLTCRLTSRGPSACLPALTPESVEAGSQSSEQGGCALMGAASADDANFGLGGLVVLLALSAFFRRRKRATRSTRN